jgi:glycine hydroxymethyltransferase
MDREFENILIKEIVRQNESIVLIASENYASKSVRTAQGSIFTNKYAEGYPGKRYYGGCEYVDQIEILAIQRAKDLFGAEHVNVQPHSGAQANMAVYSALFDSKSVIMSLPLDQGGHLTHGSKVNFSGNLYNFEFYNVDRETEQIDYEALEKHSQTVNPQAILSGFTAYPREIDFERIKSICKKIDCMMIVDMAHISGLVAAKLHSDCVKYADVVTSTTHKTLRGPRGGIILSKNIYAKSIDKAVFPNIQGGPMMHTIGAKAVAFAEASTNEFVNYQKLVISNAKLLGKLLSAEGLRIVTGDTDTHMILVDVTPFNLTGKIAEEKLAEVGLIVNRNTIPYDSNPPRVASGIRIGTPAISTRGMNAEAISIIADCIIGILKEREESKLIKNKVKELANKFPIDLK